MVYIQAPRQSGQPSTSRQSNATHATYAHAHAHGQCKLSRRLIVSIRTITMVVQSSRSDVVSPKSPGALELALIVAPSPVFSISPSGQAIALTHGSMLNSMFPQRVAYQHVLFLHQLCVFLGFALSRVAPQFFTDDSTIPPGVYEGIHELSSVVDREGQSDDQACLTVALTLLLYMNSVDYDTFTITFYSPAPQHKVGARLACWSCTHASTGNSL